MTPLEIRRLADEAARELDRGEQAMLISPLALSVLIEMLHRCEAKVEAVGAYDELHGP